MGNSDFFKFRHQEWNDYTIDVGDMKTYSIHLFDNNNNLPSFDSFCSFFLSFPIFLVFVSFPLTIMDATVFWDFLDSSNVLIFLGIAASTLLLDSASLSRRLNSSPNS